MIYCRLKQKLHEIYATLDHVIYFKFSKNNISKVDVRATYKKLEVPNLDEGFDEIFKVTIVGNGEFLVSLD